MATNPDPLRALEEEANAQRQRAHGARQPEAPWLSAFSDAQRPYGGLSTVAWGPRNPGPASGGRMGTPGGVSDPPWLQDLLRRGDRPESYEDRSSVSWPLWNAIPRRFWDSAEFKKYLIASYEAHQNSTDTRIDLVKKANGLKLVLKRISETVSAKDTEFEDQVHESSTMDKHYRNCAEAAVLLYLCMTRPDPTTVPPRPTPAATASPAVGLGAFGVLMHGRASPAPSHRESSPLHGPFSDYALKAPAAREQSGSPVAAAPPRAKGRGGAKAQGGRGAGGAKGGVEKRGRGKGRAASASSYRCFCCCEDQDFETATQLKSAYRLMHKPPHWQKWLASHASDWLCHPCTDKLAEAQDPPTAGMADQYFASVGRGQKLGRAAQVRAGRAGRARGSPAGHGDGAREGGVLSVVDMTEEAGSPEGSPPRSAAGRGGPATRSGAAKPTKPSQVLPPDISTSFPTRGPGNVYLTAKDLDYLLDEEFIHDQIILFFFKKIHADMPPRDRPRVHFFDPHFFSRLAGARAQGGAARVKAATGINYEAVSKWTKGVDIFSKHFLLIPINSALHWSLAIVCFPGHAKLTGPRPQGGSGAGEGAGGASGGAGAGSGAGGGANVGAGADVVLEVDDDGDGDGGGSDGILAANGPSPSASPNHRVSSLSWFRDPSHASQCPMVLTLDSLGETHKGLSIHSAVRMYLEKEWDRLAVSDPDSVPATVQAEHPGCKPDFSRCFPARNLPSPRQTNYYDCGLFVLTTAAYFCLKLPESVPEALGQPNSRVARAFERGRASSPKDARPRHSGSWHDILADPAGDFGFLPYARWLSARWYTPEMASSMRFRIALFILSLFRREIESNSGSLPDHHARLAQIDEFAGVFAATLRDKFGATEGDPVEEIRRDIQGQVAETEAERAACRTNTCRHASTPTKTSQGMIGTMFGMLTGVGKRGKKGEGVREAIEVDEGDEGGREGLWRVGEKGAWDMAAVPDSQASDRDGGENLDAVPGPPLRLRGLALPNDAPLMRSGGGVGGMGSAVGMSGAVGVGGTGSAVGMGDVRGMGGAVGMGGVGGMGSAVGMGGLGSGVGSGAVGGRGGSAPSAGMGESLWRRKSRVVDDDDINDPIETVSDHGSGGNGNGGNGGGVEGDGIVDSPGGSRGTAHAERAVGSRGAGAVPVSLPATPVSQHGVAHDGPGNGSVQGNGSMDGKSIHRSIDRSIDRSMDRPTPSRLDVLAPSLTPALTASREDAPRLGGAVGAATPQMALGGGTPHATSAGNGSSGGGTVGGGGVGGSAVGGSAVGGSAIGGSCGGGSGVGGSAGLSGALGGAVGSIAPVSSSAVAVAVASSPAPKLGVSEEPLVAFVLRESGRGSIRSAGTAGTALDIGSNPASSLPRPALDATLRPPPGSPERSGDGEGRGMGNGEGRGWDDGNGEGRGWGSQRSVGQPHNAAESRSPVARRPVGTGPIAGPTAGVSTARPIARATAGPTAVGLSRRDVDASLLALPRMAVPRVSLGVEESDGFHYRRLTGIGQVPFEGKHTVFVDTPEKTPERGVAGAVGRADAAAALLVEVDSMRGKCDSDGGGSVELVVDGGAQSAPQSGRAGTGARGASRGRGTGRGGSGPGKHGGGRGGSGSQLREMQRRRQRLRARRQAQESDSEWGSEGGGGSDSDGEYVPSTASRGQRVQKRGRESGDSDGEYVPSTARGRQRVQKRDRGGEGAWDAERRGGGRRAVAVVGGRGDT